MIGPSVGEAEAGPVTAAEVMTTVAGCAPKMVSGCPAEARPMADAEIVGVPARVSP